MVAGHDQGCSAAFSHSVNKCHPALQKTPLNSVMCFMRLQDAVEGAVQCLPTPPCSQAATHLCHVLLAPAIAGRGQWRSAVSPLMLIMRHPSLKPNN